MLTTSTRTMTIEQLEQRQSLTTILMIHPPSPVHDTRIAAQVEDIPQKAINPGLLTASRLNEIVLLLDVD